MCGIVGYIGSRDAVSVLLGGLSALEYRGYDSSGVAVVENGELKVTRAVGKLEELKKKFHGRNGGQHCPVGIGHTRWATHGRPTETNAHPHTAGRVSLIHNGIIENYNQLKQRLVAEGRTFSSETDTEVAAHLLDHYLEKGLDPIDAMQKMCADVRGSYAFLAIDSKNPEVILVAKNATPIIIGFGENEHLIASDIPAVLPYTRKIVILEDGDLAQVTKNSLTVLHHGKPITRETQTITWDPVTAQKGGFKHFMLKEIYDQSNVLSDTLRGRIDKSAREVALPELVDIKEKFSKVDRAVLFACGTAWHACLVGKYYIEELCGIPCEVDYASEYPYRPRLSDDRTLVVTVSQSGETLDTIQALDSVHPQSCKIAICNVLGSSITRKVDAVVYTHAGPEISVASTKAFTTQLVSLRMMALSLAKLRGTISPEAMANECEALLHLPHAVQGALETEEQVKEIAKKFYQSRDFLFLGRGSCYPIALEGALKLKEVSYIHAEGYPAGEMKHGPIALIDENMPVVVVLQRDARILPKVISNLKAVESRGGRVIVVTDAEKSAAIEDFGYPTISVPYVSQAMSPLLLSIPLQFLAYHAAILSGTDVDLPRNLAKSVTVE